MGGFLSCFSKPSTPESPNGRRLRGDAQQRSSVAGSRTEFMTSASASLVSERPLKRRIDWIVGLDFGTTFSGFAYAEASGSKEITVNYDWPKKGNENLYCKTLTALYYRRERGGSELVGPSWGYPARSEFMNTRKQGDGLGKGTYLTKFKLLLMRDLDDPALAASIPPPFTVMSIITDYLRLIGEHALSNLRNHHLGDHGFSKDSVQWVVSVPSIWDEKAKQQMKVCMVNAGLVGLGGIDAVNVVLEPEAASFHCHEMLRRNREKFSLNYDDKILVADIGGGTVDIVVQEMIGNSETFRVQELTESSGGLCGGTYVDDSFMRFLYRRIPCLENYLREDPAYKTELLRKCEEIKCAFGHELTTSSETKAITLPNNLAAHWEAYEAARGRTLNDSSAVELTHQDLKAIFAPVVEDILSLIAAQLAKVPNIKVMFVVGGFADSRYLMQCIRARFGREVTYIVSPPQPGSAIVQGAVSLGLQPEAIVSRIAKKTYGTSFSQPFEHGRDPISLLRERNGAQYCHSRFDVFVRRGERMNVDLSKTRNYVPFWKGQREMVFDLWSSSDKEPRYAHESMGSTKEGAFAVSLPEKFGAAGDERPQFKMTMNFRRGHIEVRAAGNIPGDKGRSLVLPVKYCG